MQAEVLAWSQKDGKDVLVPSDALVVSPPIFRVAGGASQIVRVGLVRPNDPERELTYRLFLQEVPEPSAPNAQGINVALRLGLPIFVAPNRLAAPRLDWRAEADGDALRLIVTNTGNAHVQLIECRVARDDGRSVAQQPLAAYVLPGATRSWTLRTSETWRGHKLRVTATTGSGEMSAVVAAP